MQIHVNILDHKASFFMDLLRSLDYVVSIEAENEDVSLTEAEKRNIDSRLEQMEKKGVKGVTFAELRAKIKDQDGL